MLFAETDTSMNALLMGLLALVVVATQIAREWRDSLRAKNAKDRDDAVRTALIVSERSTAGKLQEVTTTLARKSEDIGKVVAALEENTAMTAETKSIVQSAQGEQSDRDKMREHVKALQKLMEDHGIECPPHPAEK